MTGVGPSVSVIIPALDEERSVAGAIRSAREAGADEVIVVDGGSADGTVSSARGLADSVIVAGRGRALQMNAGAEVASGEVLLFLHADTRLPPGAIGAVRSAVSAKGAEGGAFSVELMPERPAGAYRKTLLAVTARMIGVRARLFRSYTGDQGMFVNKTVFREIGGFPEIPLMEDVELSRSLARRGRTLLLPLRVATSARRWESRGPARTILIMWGLRIGHLLGMSPARCARIYRQGPRA